MSRQRMVIIGLEILVPVFVVLTWAALSANSTSFYFPPLSVIAETFVHTWDLERVKADVLPSLGRLFAGYACAVVVGVVAGVGLGLSRRSRANMEPIIEFLRALPPPALIPVGILVLGIGDTMKIAVITVGSMWPVLLNAVEGVRAIDQTKLDFARVYQLSRRERIRRIVIPAASPQIFSGLRTSLSIAVILMVISEMVASTNGIGYFVLQSERTFAIEEMWSGIILLGLLGYTLSVVFMAVERRALRWHEGSQRQAR